MYRYCDARDVGRGTACGRLAPGGLGGDRFTALSDHPIRGYGMMKQPLARSVPDPGRTNMGGVTLTR